MISPLAIAVDNSGNAFVTGNSTAPNGYYDYATVAYSGSGAPLWTNRYDGLAHAEDRIGDVAVDSSGNVFVTGSSTNGATDRDYATVAYSGAGVPLWTNRYNGPANGPDWGAAMAVDRNGNVVVTGSSYGSTSSSGYATIKYSSSVRPYLQIRRLNNQAVLTWSNSGFALQSAPVTTGTFTNIPGATNPYTNSSAGAQQYFRLKSN